MTEEEVKALLKRYRTGTLTPDEQVRLEAWYNSEAGRSGSELSTDSLARLSGRMRAAMQQTSPAKTKLLTPQRIAIAASLLLFLCAGILFYRQKTNDKQDVTLIHDVKPGTNKATLTLAGGSAIPLDDRAKGVIDTHSGATATQTGGGALVYSSVSRSAHPARGGMVAEAWNTLTTPKGGQYQVVLPDGSHVWLNAASSLTYPVAFTGKQRKVILKGEAYFEITKNKKQPFIVQSTGQTVEVLGTHFNVNAYPDEPGTATTLLEGSVRVQEGKHISIIRPGEQATVRNGITVDQVDTDVAVAWKNGKTYFRDADIPTMMRSLSRWYNIEVVFEGPVKHRQFTGGISREANLSEMLSILELSGIHVTLRDRKLIVRP